MRIGRAAALRVLWTAVSGRRHPDAPGLGRSLVAVPRLVLATLTGRYPAGDRSRLGLMLLAVLYVVSPVDLVPEAALLLVGLVDDAIVLAWLAGAVMDEAESFLAWEGAAAAPGAADPRVVPGQVV